MLDKRGYGKFVILLALIVILGSFTAEAAEYSLSVSGLQPIFLAGRSDLEPISDPNAGVDTLFPLERYPSSPDVTYATEILPAAIGVFGGDKISFGTDDGYTIKYKIVWGKWIEAGPDGTGVNSDYSGVGGISGYMGPSGALLGVFLDNKVPLDEAPATIDFGKDGVGTQFDTLYPKLGQVFFIGDGYNDAGSIQTFVAPSGAGRLFLGVADGKSDGGKPGYYGNNEGSFEVTAYLPDAATTATVEMRPNKLTLRTRGRYIKAYIELQGEYDASMIDRSSVMITEINGIPLDKPIHAVRYSRIGDRDKDGIPDLKVKFSRRKLVPHLSAGVNDLTIAGVVKGGPDFEGFGEITAKAKKHKKKCRKKRR